MNIPPFFKHCKQWKKAVISKQESFLTPMRRSYIFLTLGGTISKPFLTADKSSQTKANELRPHRHRKMASVSRREQLDFALQNW